MNTKAAFAMIDSATIACSIIRRCGAVGGPLGAWWPQVSSALRGPRALASPRSWTAIAPWASRSFRYTAALPVADKRASTTNGNQKGEQPRARRSKKPDNKSMNKEAMTTDASSSSSGKRKHGVVGGGGPEAAAKKPVGGKQASAGKQGGGGQSAGAASGSAAGGHADRMNLGRLERVFKGEEVPDPKSVEEKMLKRFEKIEDPAEKAKYKYRCLFARVSKEDDIEAAERLYAQSQGEGRLDSEMYNLLLSMMSTHNRPDMIRMLYEDMKVIGLPNNEAAYATLMRCISNEGRPEEAEALLDKMVNSGIKTKIRSYDAILHGYCKLLKADHAFAIYGRMKADGLEATDSEYAALVRLLTGVITTTTTTTGGGEDGKSTREAAEKRFNVVLEDMQQTVFELSAEVIDALSEWYSQKEGSLVSRPASVTEAGLCTSCGDVLRSIDLPAESVQSLIDKLDAIVREDPQRVSRWDDFLRTLKSREFDVILDGANIGYYNASHHPGQQCVNYEQIAWVTEHLQEEGYKPLIVLQYRHVKHEWTPEQYHGLIKQWNADNLLLIPPLKTNDDWYWMYAALARSGTIAVITNDEMRDHTFQMVAARDFRRWKDRHLARFYMEGYVAGKNRRRKINIQWPTAYSRCIQQTASGWHYPEAAAASSSSSSTDDGANQEAQEAPPPGTWLCARSLNTATEAKPTASSAS